MSSSTANSRPSPRDPRSDHARVAPAPPLPMARWARWFVALAALALVAASLGSYFYHRRQMDSIAARHLRLAVAGPRQWQAGAPCTFDLLATQVNGRPWPSPVKIQWSLSTPDGKLVDHEEFTDEQGRLVMTVPRDMALPARDGATAQLAVTAGGTAGGGGDAAAGTTLPLTIRGPQYMTRLATDRRRYRPGDTIYYRSLTVTRYGLADPLRGYPDRPQALQFEILDAKSAPLPDSQWVGLTDRGVGNGSFRLPVSIAPGIYTLAARSDRAAASESRQAFEVAAADASADEAEEISRNGAKPQRDPAVDRGPMKKIEVGNQPSPSAARPRGEGSRLRVEFFPEGGTLAAGLQNCVYFQVRDAQGQPLAVRGNVVDGKGEKVASLESSGGGRGKFSFVPAAGETYQAKINEPARMPGPSPLPLASSAQKIAIAVQHGVIASGAPLRLELHAAKANVPLVIAAQSDGLTVGQQMLITQPAETSGASLTIPLDDGAAGAVRVNVYDCSQNPPQIVARRLVYRQPRLLFVRTLPSLPGKGAGGEGKPEGDVMLSVENENGQPVAAALSVTVLSGGTSPHPLPEEEATELRPDLVRQLLLAGDTPDAVALKGVDFTATSADAVAEANLALGCQNFAPQGKSAAAPGGRRRPAVVDEAATLPTVIDNLGELRQRYEAALGEYRAQRTRVVNALIMLSFFGGLALALLVTMLALLRIVWGSQLWLPTVVAAICCAIVTAVSNDPSRMQAVDAAAGGFATTVPAAGGVGVPPAKNAADPLPADNPLRRLAEKLAKFGADADELKADRFPVQQYAAMDVAGAASPDAADKPLAWFPLLIAGSHGRVALPGVKASAAKGVRLLIEARGEGRMTSCELTLK